MRSAALSAAAAIMLPLNIAPSLRYPDRLLRLGRDVEQRLPRVPQRIRYAYQAGIGKERRSRRSVRLVDGIGQPRDASIRSISEIVVLRVVEAYYRGFEPGVFTMRKLFEVCVSSLRHRSMGLELSDCFMSSRLRTLNFRVRPKVSRNGIPTSFQLIRVQIPVPAAKKRK